MNKFKQSLAEAAYEYEVLRLENIKLRHALRSVIDAFDRAAKSGEGFSLTQEEAERLKAVQAIL